MKRIALLFIVLICNMAQAYALSILDILENPTLLELKIPSCDNALPPIIDPELVKRYKTIRDFLEDIDGDEDKIEAISNTLYLKLISEIKSKLPTLTGKQLADWQLLYSGITAYFAKKTNSRKWGKESMDYIKKSMDTDLNIDNVYSFASAMAAISEENWVKRTVLTELLDIDLQNEAANAIKRYNQLPGVDQKDEDLKVVIKKIQDYLND